MFLVFSDANSKADVFLSRYQLLLQRTTRHELFMPDSAGNTTMKSNQKYKLKTVECLLSTTARQDDAIALGMLTQVKHGSFSLEDPTGAVPLDLAEAKFHKGLYTENCFVLVEGWYEGRGKSRRKHSGRTAFMENLKTSFRNLDPMPQKTREHQFLW